MEKVLYVQLLGIRAEDYTTYVFKILDTTDITNQFIMAVKPPNWKNQNLEIGDIGFVKIQKAIAGQPFIDKDGTKNIFKYSCNYFLDFIKETVSEKTPDFQINFQF